MIYIIEDDAEIREMESYALQKSGFDVETFNSCKPLYEKLKSTLPDLFVLDIMLPGEDGLSFLKSLRSMDATRNIPVLMLTAKGTELDKVKGLDLGADDYMTKPFGILEFISRVKALLRRGAMTSNSAVNGKNLLQMGGIVIDEERRSVSVNGTPCNLAFKEYELLKMLLQNLGIVFSRQEIMERVWGVEFSLETRTVDMHVKNLRQKLGECGDIIKTIRNVGYKAEV